MVMVSTKRRSLCRCLLRIPQLMVSRLPNFSFIASQLKTMQRKMKSLFPRTTSGSSCHRKRSTDKSNVMKNEANNARLGVVAFVSALDQSVRRVEIVRSLT